MKNQKWLDLESLLFKQLQKRLVYCGFEIKNVNDCRPDDLQPRGKDDLKFNVGKNLEKFRDVIFEALSSYLVRVPDGCRVFIVASDYQIRLNNLFFIHLSSFHTSYQGLSMGAKNVRISLTDESIDDSCSSPYVEGFLDWEDFMGIMESEGVRGIEARMNNLINCFFKQIIISSSLNKLC